MYNDNDSTLNSISLIMLEHLIYDCGTGEFAFGTGEFAFDTGEPVLTLDELYNLFPEALEAAEEAFTDAMDDSLEDVKSRAMEGLAND